MVRMIKELIKKEELLYIQANNNIYFYLKFLMLL